MPEMAHDWINKSILFYSILSTFGFSLNLCMICCRLLCVAIILIKRRELVALLGLSSWCLLGVVWLFLAVPWVHLGFVIVVFPDHTHLILLWFFKSIKNRNNPRNKNTW